MPRRRYNRRRRRPRRRYARPRATGWGWTVPKYAYKAFNIALANADKLKLLNVEVKRYDQSSSGTVALAATGLNPTVLSDIAQGDTDVTRDGNSLKCTGLDLRFRFNQPATPADQQIRICVVMLKRASIASLDSAEVWETPSSSISFRNIDKSRTIKVLRDVFIDMDQGNKDFRTYKMHIPLSQHIKFDNSTSTSDQYGGLGVFIWTSEATNRAQYLMNSRLRFVDN